MDDCDQWWWQQDLELQALEIHMKKIFAIALLIFLEVNRETI